MYISNDVRTWTTWDRYSIYARIQDEEQTGSFPKKKKKKKWTGRKPKTDEQKTEFRKSVMEKGGDKIHEDLVTFQKTLEIAAGGVAHHTKAERETIYRVRRRVSDYVRKLLQDARKRSRGQCSRNRPGKRGLNTW